MSKSFLYVGMYYDIFENRDIGIKDKKIGITTNPNNRENSLNATKGPIGYMFIKLYECEGEITADNIESIFHTLLEDRNTIGEWYKDEDEVILDSVSSVINNLKNLGITIKEIDLGLDPNLSKVEKEQIQRAKSTKLKVIYKGQDISERFAVDTFIKVHKVIGEIVGWENMIKDGKYDIFNSVEEFHNNYPYFKRDNNGYHEVNGSIIYSSFSNANKLKRINKLNILVDSLVAFRDDYLKVIELAKERDKVLQAYYKERTAWNKLNPNDKVQSVSLSELFDD